MSRKAADIAESSFKMARLSEERQEEEDKALHRMYLRDVIRLAEDICDALASTAHGELDFWAIAKAHEDPGIQPHVMVKYFTQKELELIDTIWANFLRHKQTHWVGPDGTMNGSFNGDRQRNVKESAETIEPTVRDALEDLRCIYKST